MIEDKTHTLILQTPEGISFSMLVASPVTRALALLIDILCIGVAAMVLGIVLSFAGAISPDVSMALYMISYFLLSIGYGIVLEWFWRGQTLGKKVLGLRVMDEQGLHLEFSQIVVRNLLRFVDSLPALYLVGGTAALISSKGQRLGDYAANTVVVREPAIEEPDLEQITAGKYNSFRDYPHIAARLRQRASAAEAGVALQAILRRETLDDVSRVEVFEELAHHFKSLVEFPQEATDGISDEQYIRNTVDVLFRTK